MSCLPQGDVRERIIQAQGALLSEAYIEQINVLMENTGACEVCAKNLCSTALCKLLIEVFVKDYDPTREEAEEFEKGIISLCNSLIAKRRGHSAFHPSDN